MATGAAHRARLRAALFLGVGLAATGLGLVAYGTNVFRELELDTVDARFTIRGERKPAEQIEVVAIDDITFSEFNSNREPFAQYPFPRRVFAKVIDRLAADGAKVIAYDIQFTEQTTPEDDNALIDSVAKAGNVILATTEVDPLGRTNVFGGDEVVKEIGARVGNGNFPLDPGGVIRRVAYTVDKLKSFSVVTAEQASGKTIDPDDFPGESTWIDYAGGEETVRPFSFSYVYYKEFPKGSFKDKIVVVGPSAVTLQDIHPTSTSTSMAGAEIQANATATALDGFPLRSAPGVVTVVLIVLLGLVPPLLGLRLSLMWTLVAALAGAAGYVVATQLSFQAGRVLSFVYPFGTLVLSSVGSLGAHYLLAAFERERVRDMFSRFVPEAVVEQVLARTDADLRLGGQTMTGTCMFTDLRGFTTFSEVLPAARVIEILNVYLSEMSEAILAHGGTLVAYMGDGIFAVYGAPIEQPDHADRALAASREMLAERLPRVNEWLREQGVSEEGFRMGIGLNSGQFMSGNVGSERRLEYAAIGDVTNTASRLEGMTKGQEYYLFMSDMTKEMLTQPVDDLAFVDELEVRGRQSKVKIWSVEAASVAAFAARREATSVEALPGTSDPPAPEPSSVERSPAR